VTNLASFSTSLNFEPLGFENTARYPNAETNFLCRNDRPVSSQCIGEVRSTHLESRLSAGSQLIDVLNDAKCRTF